MMRGHLGQYVIANLTDDVIIVRLGHDTASKPSKETIYPQDIYDYIDEAYKMLGVRI